jgi:hypothetical protein
VCFIVEKSLSKSLLVVGTTFENPFEKIFFFLKKKKQKVHQMANAFTFSYHKQKFASGIFLREYIDE